jgi:LacI family transcriptional regulator
MAIRQRTPPRPTRQRKPRPSRGATIRDVAAGAGVSVATVSRVLNRKGPIRQTTSKRVLDVAGALDYVPHAAARSLSISRTHTVGVLLPDLHGEFFSEVIRGVDLASRRIGYHLLLSGSHSDPEEMAAVLAAMRGRVDGIIVMLPDAQAQTLRSRFPPNLPVVLLNSPADAPYSITIDNYGGARRMVEHLSGLGHRRIAFIKGPKGNADADERLRGFRRAMHRLVEGRVSALEVPGDFSEASGYVAVRAIMAMTPRPTAIFAANDSMAVGALCALREARIDVPQTMALSGFDDIPIARYVNPPLTTVNVAIAELGRKAFEMVVESIESPDSRGRHCETVPTTLVIRQSCGSSPDVTRSVIAGRPS